MPIPRMRNIEAQSVILGDNCQQWDHEGHFSALQLKLLRKGPICYLSPVKGVLETGIYIKKVVWIPENISLTMYCSHK